MYIAYEFCIYTYPFLGIEKGTCRGGDDCAQLVGGYCDSVLNLCKCGAAFGVVSSNVCLGLGKRAVNMNNYVIATFLQETNPCYICFLVFLHIQYFQV